MPCLSNLCSVAAAVAAMPIAQAPHTMLVVRFPVSYILFRSEFAEPHVYNLLSRFYK